MKKIKKLTAVQPVSLLPETKETVKMYCDEAVFYDTEPESDRELIDRISDSDAIFAATGRLVKGFFHSARNLNTLGCAAAFTHPRAPTWISDMRRSMGSP